MPSQPDNLDGESLSSYSVRPRGSGSPQTGNSGLPLPSEALEFSDALENSTPLEVRRVKYVIAPTKRTVPAPVDAQAVERSQPYVQSPPVQPVSQPVFPTELLSAKPILESDTPAPTTDEYVQEIVVPLLDERVVVDRRRRKVGEVVVRKEIETQIVEVPIHREKLIIEQVSPQFEQLAVLELGSPQIANSVVSAGNEATQPSVSGKFASTAEAIQFLAAIAAESNAGQHNVQITVLLEDAAQQALYQRLLEQYSADRRR